MKILVIVTHPKMKTSKVNKHLITEVNKVEQIDLLDLYAEYPNCDIDVKKEQERVLQYDRIVLQFPFYWYSSPPLLKAWFDRILTPGYAYGRNGSKLEGIEVVVVTTVGSKEHAYKPDGYQKYSVAALLRPMQATCDLVKLKYLQPFMIYNADRLEESEIISETKNYLAHIQDKNLRTFGVYEGDYNTE